jgi:hypothetical protein
MNATGRAVTGLRDDYERRHEEGRRTFGRLIRHWFRVNDWRNIPTALQVHSMMAGCRWLHNSQIAQLMNAQVSRCATQQFYCLAELNRVVWEVQQGMTTLPAHLDPLFWNNAQPLLNDEDQPMDIGDFMRVWFGEWEPSFLKVVEESPSEAAERLRKACKILFASVPLAERAIAVAGAPAELRDVLAAIAFEKTVEIDELVPLVPLLEDWLKAWI